MVVFQTCKFMKTQDMDLTFDDKVKQNIDLYILQFAMQVCLIWDCCINYAYTLSQSAVATLSEVYGEISLTFDLYAEHEDYLEGGSQSVYRAEGEIYSHAPHWDTHSTPLFKPKTQLNASNFIQFLYGVVVRPMVRVWFLGSANLYSMRIW